MVVGHAFGGEPLHEAFADDAAIEWVTGRHPAPPMPEGPCLAARDIRDLAMVYVVSRINSTDHLRDHGQ